MLHWYFLYFVLVDCSHSWSSVPSLPHAMVSKAPTFIRCPCAEKNLPLLSNDSLEWNLAGRVLTRPARTKPLVSLDTVVDTQVQQVAKAKPYVSLLGCGSSCPPLSSLSYARAKALVNVYLCSTYYFMAQIIVIKNDCLNIEHTSLKNVRTK